MKLRSAWMIVALASAAMAVPAAQNNAARTQLEAARKLEVVDGDLKGAIKQYNAIVETFKNDRAVVADALVRLAECYQTLGDSRAQQIYQRILREYSDRAAAVAVARARATPLEESGRGKSSKIAVRHVWTSDFVDGRPSPDGRYLPWVNYPGGLRHGGGGNLALHDLTTGENRDVTHHTGDASFAETAFFTPDSKHILYSWFDAPANQFELRMIGVDGSNEHTVAHGLVRSGAVSSDGKVAAVEIFQNRISQIALVALASGRITVLKTVDWRQPQVGNFSPDGRYLVYSLLARQESQDREIYAIAVDGSSESRLVAAPGAHRGPFFAPDGEHVVFTSNRSGGRWDLWSVRVSNGKADRGPELLKTDVGAVSSMGFTNSGALYYLQQLDQQDAYEADIDPATWRIASPPRRVSDRFVSLSSAPKWSPDGTSLAYVARKGGTARYEGGDVTFVVRAGDAGPESEVTAPIRAAENAGFFRWFPDKKSLLLVGYGPTGRSFQRLDLTTGQLRNLFETRQSSLSVIVSADGRAILYPITDMEDRTLKHLVRRHLETGDERSVLDARTGGTGSAAFHGLAASPDGRQIAYIGGDEQGIWVAELAAGEPREVWRAADRYLIPQALAWDAEGRGVLVTSKKDQYAKPEEIWYVPVDGREPHSTGVAMPRARVTSVHPNGRRIGFTGGDVTAQVWTLENLFPASR